MKKIPELVLPAGNLEKLELAFNYGADAVYLAGENFGLRSRAENFSRRELAYATKEAHLRGKRIYVVLNAFLHGEQISQLPDFVRYLQQIEVDALVISDVGVLSTVQSVQNIQSTQSVRAVPSVPSVRSIPVHLSTQASCLNVAAVKFWKSLGVSRIILAREVSIAEAKKIKVAADVEVEMFVHGSRCISYSGHCVMSNFVAHRDSNRGGCAHNCRHQYMVKSLADDGKLRQGEGFLMSSSDLLGIHCLPEFIDAGIDALKVEGRMKNHLYVGT
ncbi:MAG: U32 family peptidase, partial [Oligoflexia bacterium]|nr:U32 family peptidase [Oligoflexia bacterium]